MSLLSYRILAVGALLTVATAAHAQEAHPHVCGTEIMGRADHSLFHAAPVAPATHQYVLRPGLRRDKLDAALQSSSAGDVEFEFWVRNSKTNEYSRITATLVYEGKRARIWIHNDELSRINQTTINRLTRALDTAVDKAGSVNPNKGILENDQDLFGMPPTSFQLDGMDDFLFLDIQDPVPNSYILGYFSPSDQEPASQNPYSNEMNLLYIDSRQGLQSMDGLLNTIAHEYQHLIHYVQHPYTSQSDVLSHRFFNEGSSELASILNGYPERPNTFFLQNTNFNLLEWTQQSKGNNATSNDIELDYQRAMTFMLYSFEQGGQTYLRNFTQSKKDGIERVDDALAASGNPNGIANWRDLFSNFSVANYLQTDKDPRYGYKFRPSSARATVAKTFTAANLPSTGQVSLKPYGTVYHLYNTPGTVTAQFTGNAPFRVMAMMYKGNDVTVRQMNTGAEQTNLLSIGSNAYDKIVLAFISLESPQTASSFTVDYTVSQITLGVENEVIAAGMGMASVSPNPVTDRSLVEFSSAGRGATRLELYDARGILLQTLVDGQRLAKGSHQATIDATGLPSGAYFLRLSEAGASVTKSIVIER